MYQAGSQDTDLTIFKEAGFLRLNFGFMGGVASYHHITDTVARLDPAGLQTRVRICSASPRIEERDLAGLRSENDTVFFTVFGHLIAYPMWLVWPLAGLALAAVIAAGVMARHKSLATTQRLLAGLAATLLPIIGAPLAAIGLRPNAGPGPARDTGPCSWATHTARSCTGGHWARLPSRSCWGGIWGCARGLEQSP
jgi:hypothetical protein